MLISCLIDISEDNSPVASQLHEEVNRELGLFNADLLAKPQVVAIGKIDLPAVRERLKKEIDIFREKGIEVSAFSAVTGEGMEGVMQRIVLAMERASATC